MSQSPDLFSIAVPILIVLLSLTVHEAAHAWTADRLGDPTARLLGRISLNPIVHIDVIGTIVLPLLAVISGFPVIGWAKPVPVNISRLRRHRQDFMLVAAAGPASNILIAIAAGILMRIVPQGSLGGSPYLDLHTVLYVAGQINIFLAVFNLIPIPPLDGGNVLAGLLPASAAAALDSLRPFGFILLYVLMFSGILGELIVPPALFLIRLLLQ
jgi:Zn-dependent protease